MTQVKSKGIPKWAQAAHQKSGPPSAHKMYKPGSGKSEEVEIDELSKDTLGSYTKKAAKDIEHTTREGGLMYGKIRKRVKGIGKAADKLSKE